MATAHDKLPQIVEKVKDAIAGKEAIFKIAEEILQMEDCFEQFTMYSFFNLENIEEEGFFDFLVNEYIVVGDNGESVASIYVCSKGKVYTDEDFPHDLLPQLYRFKDIKIEQMH